MCCFFRNCRDERQALRVYSYSCAVSGALYTYHAVADTMIDLDHYRELLLIARDELKTVQTRMVRDKYKGNAKDRVARALRQTRKAIESIDSNG